MVDMYNTQHKLNKHIEDIKMDKFQQYLEQKRMFHFEGDVGVRNLNKLVDNICGYNDIINFLADNPGATQAIVEWIEQNVETVDEWNENLNELVPDEE